MTTSGPESAEASHRLGVAALRSRDAASAVAHFRRAVSADPENADAQMNLGVALRLAGAHAESRRALAAAGKLRPDSAQVQYNLAIADVEAGDSRRALDRMEEAVRLAPKSANIRSALAALQTKAGRTRDGLRNFRKAAALEPDSAARHHNLGGALLAGGDTEAAIAALRKAIAIDPDRVGSQFHLANALITRRRSDEALALYRDILHRNPDTKGIHEKFGDALRYEEQHAIAAEAFSAALDRSPGDARIAAKLADALSRTGRGEEALEVLRGIEDTGRRVFVAKRTGEVLERMGRFEEAAEMHQRILRDDSGNVWALAALVDNRATELSPEQRHALVSAAESRAIPSNAQAAANFALGQLLDSDGEYARAFEAFARANRVHQQQKPFDAEAHQAFTDEVIRVFTPEFVESGRDLSSDSELPVFLAGMPRAGITLAEQILAGHSEVHAGGELQDLELLRRKLEECTGAPFPGCLADVDRAPALRLRDELLSRRRALAPGARRVADKTPVHAFQLGLAALFFPSAAIVHCRRDPLDVCLSIHFQNFAGSHPYASDLRALGLYARDTARVMRHWQSFLPVLEVRYEDTVADVETAARAMVGHVGLEWEDGVLDYRSRIGVVATASQWQVRQPIYGTSVGRWRNYEQFLDPLRQALGDELA